MNQKKHQNVSQRQYDVLGLLKASKKQVVIFLTNGVQLHGTITDYDEFSVKMKGNDGRNRLIYKHAISTIEY